MTRNDPTPLTLRVADPRDRDVIAEFNVRLAAQSEGKQLEPQVVRSGVEHALADPARGTYYLAECDGQVVGQTLITREWSDWRDGWFWWIQSVYVHPDHRGRGVYRALHEHVEREARSRGDVCGLRLYVDEHNRRAIETYARLGMSPSGYLIYETDWSDAISPTSNDPRPT